MKIIEKKVWPEYFEKILSGSKTFELRLNDFDVEEGDELFLREYDPKTKEYTGRELRRKAGFVGKWKISDLNIFWSEEEIKQKGLVVISLL